ncbi:MAG: hypothetical protein M9949_11285 [Candidatus Kapabacteria bacterium]|nr:hypothetical protein [Candidatus Kapabacteria bacterium]
MKNIIIILIIMICGWNTLLSQGIDFNTPVLESGNLTCLVITPLSVTPTWHGDFLNWPTVPVGSKYEFGTNGDEDSDRRSIFTFTGESARDIEICLETETMKDNVEIFFTFRGTQTPQIGQPLNGIPLLNFNDSKEIVNLSAEGKYYLHIIYHWVWAHDGAEPGLKVFVQTINAQYHNL